ncbi:MAG: outer membrane beta-barrel protein [Pseudomonadota bacterium]
MTRFLSIAASGAAFLTAALWTPDAQAQFYVRGHLMVTNPSDDSASAVTENGIDAGSLDASFDAGLGFGGSVGWVFAERFRAEADFTYLSADVDRATLGDGFSADGDNFASTGLGVNLLYHFTDDIAGKQGFSPYIGLGVVFLNEIDIDLEGAGVGQGFEDLEGDDVAPQLILGVNRGIGKRWSLGGELRYLAGGGIDLENDAVQIRDIDYDSLNLGLTLTYWFD